MESLQVELGDRSYPIQIGGGLIPSLVAKVSSLLAAGRKVCLVTDANIASKQKAVLDALSQLEGGSVGHLVLEAGETTKSLTHLERIFDWLAELKVDRGGVLIALGGGVIGDLAGFAAASYLRGIDFIQIPTTLLAMVDSSVGGKTGINIKAGKNLVGAFYQPLGVFADMDLLASLPEREFSAGMAEVIKYGMLYDLSLFEQLTELDLLSPQHEALPAVVKRCCEIKAEIVKADEKETAKSGGRALLNLGHTFAHGVENVAGYGQYLHGEAVGLGLVLAAKLSQRLGHIDEQAVEACRALVERYHLPTQLREPLSIDALLAAMMRDKKVRQGKLRFVVMQAIGEAITTDAVSEEWVIELWKEVGAV